jgi:hypothetical protein
MATGDYPAAAGDLEHALALYRDVGDHLGQAQGDPQSLFGWS